MVGSGLQDCGDCLVCGRRVVRPVVRGRKPTVCGDAACSRERERRRSAQRRQAASPAGASPARGSSAPSSDAAQTAVDAVVTVLARLFLEQSPGTSTDAAAAAAWQAVEPALRRLVDIRAGRGAAS